MLCCSACMWLCTEGLCTFAMRGCVFERHSVCGQNWEQRRRCLCWKPSLFHSPLLSVVPLSCRLHLLVLGFDTLPSLCEFLKFPFEQFLIFRMPITRLVFNFFENVSSSRSVVPVFWSEQVNFQTWVKKHDGLWESSQRSFVYETCRSHVKSKRHFCSTFCKITTFVPNERLFSFLLLKKAWIQSILE